MSDEHTNRRKLEHIEIIRDDRGVDRGKHWFDQVHLRHRALPELNLDEVDASCTFLGKPLSFPLLISSMTGGDHELVQTINRNLAIAAERCRVAMGVGSQRVMFTNPAARSSFELREHAPNTLLFSNLGAVQLNCGLGLEACREAVAAVGADALYFHLNPLQEAVQPEGDTDFSGLAKRIGDIVTGLDLPVMVKEVGAGISPADAELLVRQGVRVIDVAGSGGTSWSRIEHHRNREEGGEDLGLQFQDWGVPTPLALQELAPFRMRDQVSLVASGGIRSGIDMVKAVVLGASLAGLASPLLEPAKESPEAVVRVIEKLEREFRTAMFLLGVPAMDRLLGNSDLLQ